jgi:hypothetical protein
MKYNFLFTDLWPYALIALFFLFCNLFKPKYSSKIIYLILFIFSALRYDIGWDYTAYVSEIESGYDSIMNSRFEILNKYIFLIGSYLNFYPIVFAIYSFLMLRIIYYSINKYSVNPLLSWLVFYSMPLFFFASLSTIRQSLAMILVFYSYKYVIEKKQIIFFAIIFIATLFHTSAIVGVLLFPIMIFPIGKITNIILFLGSFFIGEVIITFINATDFFLLSKIQTYLRLGQAEPELINYLYYAFGIFNLLFYNKLVKLNSQNMFIITIINFGLVLLNLLSAEPITSLRISAIFLMFLIYLVPYYVLIFNKRSSKLVSNILVSGFLSLSFFYIFLYINGYKNGVLDKVSFLPYKFWFNHF